MVIINGPRWAFFTTGCLANGFNHAYAEFKWSSFKMTRYNFLKCGKYKAQKHAHHFERKTKLSLLDAKNSQKREHCHNSGIRAISIATVTF